MKINVVRILQESLDIVQAADEYFDVLYCLLERPILSREPRLRP
jgi:hypothetical protein